MRRAAHTPFRFRSPRRSSGWLLAGLLGWEPLFVAIGVSLRDQAVVDEVFTVSGTVASDAPTPPPPPTMAIRPARLVVR